MSNNRIKVVGYAKKDFFGNGIEYRPFSWFIAAGSSSVPLYRRVNATTMDHLRLDLHQNWMAGTFLGQRPRRSEVEGSNEVSKRGREWQRR